ncbi:MAG: hypothetical protein SWE60_20065 [Thermodesulfobacteriota bacterium]|nr:hypothetical protein [Thermodesulfobacteriota bacterium]
MLAKTLWASLAFNAKRTGTSSGPGPRDDDQATVTIFVGGDYD